MHICFIFNCILHSSSIVPPQSIASLIINSCVAAYHYWSFEDVGGGRWAGLFIHKYICDVCWEVWTYETKTILSLFPPTALNRHSAWSSTFSEPPMLLRNSHMSPQRCHSNNLKTIMHFCPKMQMKQGSRLNGLQVDRRFDRMHVVFGSHKWTRSDGNRFILNFYIFYSIRLVDQEISILWWCYYENFH